MDKIKNILSRYESISGQKINFQNSELVCRFNGQNEVLDWARDQPEVKTVDIFSKFLGLPILFSQNKSSMFKFIEERMP